MVAVVEPEGDHESYTSTLPQENISMADREVREYHHTSSDSGMGGAMWGAIALGVVLSLGAMFFMFAERSPNQTASGPAIERTTPAPTTTGQGTRERAPAPKQ